MAAGDSASISLEQTPTWAIATLCFVIISISIILEHIFHLLTNWLKGRRETALYDAMGRLKSELMLLGFISLLLAVTQQYISKICVPSEVADTMLPCRKQVVIAETQSLSSYRHFADGPSAYGLIWDDVKKKFDNDPNLQKEIG